MSQWWSTALGAAALSTILGGAAGCAEAGAEPAHTGGVVVTTEGGGASSGSEGDFHYEKALSAPKALEVHGINGSIHALGAASSTAEVRAIRRPEKGTISQRVVVNEYDGGVVICALAAGEPDSNCRPGDDSVHSGKRDGDHDVGSIDFEVRVPAGVPFTARTMNGKIEAKEMRGQVRVLTMNGDVEASTNGHLVARSMNGRVTGVITGAVGAPVQLDSMNGDVELQVAGGSNFDLSATTMNGKIRSDFPLPASQSEYGPPAPVQAKVGRGGMRVALKTMSCDVVLKRQ